MKSVYPEQSREKSSESFTSLRGAARLWRRRQVRAEGSLRGALDGNVGRPARKRSRRERMKGDERIAAKGGDDSPRGSCVTEMTPPASLGSPRPDTGSGPTENGAFQKFSIHWHRLICKIWRPAHIKRTNCMINIPPNHPCSSPSLRFHSNQLQSHITHTPTFLLIYVSWLRWAERVRTLVRRRRIIPALRG